MPRKWKNTTGRHLTPEHIAKLREGRDRKRGSLSAGATTEETGGKRDGRPVVEELPVSTSPTVATPAETKPIPVVPAIEDLAKEPVLLSMPGLATVGADGKPIPTPKKSYTKLSPKVITKTVARIHKSVAQWTQFDGFRLDADDEELWDVIAQWIMDNIDYRNLPILLAVLAIVAMEGGKVGEYMAWKKNNPSTGRAQGNAPPSGALEQPASGPVLSKNPGLL